MNVWYLWLIPFFPLLSSLVIRLFGRWALSRRTVHALACGSVAASLLVTVYGFFSLAGAHEPLSTELFRWISVGTFDVWVRFRLDSLSSVMALVVCGVGFLIHIYSTGYMGEEKSFERYFAFLNLFMAMMLVLVLADSLLLMFVGWEGVGLCSYFLIGFWFGEKANADAGKKAFIVNRIGDFGFLLGIFSLFWTLGMATDVWSTDFEVLKQNVSVFSNATIFGVSVATLATLFLFAGATGKSAQIPLYVWLPDAMAGPTPVSALIHAATMVTAGVYMIARLSFLFDVAPFTLHVVAVVGALTALFAATIGLVQNDIKKVLAYSTVSQLGYMFLACGVGAYAAAIFHLMTHAFFKALLFLGAGSVIHALHHEQDIRNMGGLKASLPWTHRTFLVATLAIAGIPPFAGFFSKDTILWESFAGKHGSVYLWAIGLITAGLTAFYMFRLVFLTFYGKTRLSPEKAHHVHESPKSMIVPLMILGVLSTIGGWLWWPEFLPLTKAFPEWLSEVVVLHEPHGTHAQEILLALTSVGVAVVGILLARKFYLTSPELPGRLVARMQGVHRFVLDKYRLDELYQATVVRGLLRLSAASAWFDRVVVDGLVNGSAWFLRGLVFIKGSFDRLVVDGLVNLLAWFTFWLGRQTRRLQTGQLQMYLGAIVTVMLAVGLVWTFFVVGNAFGR